MAWSHAEAQDIARREDAELIGAPVEWRPGKGPAVFWNLDHGQPAATH
ncbi:MAG: hypothetical protein AAFX07_03940 [Pseudomonadota bacterium]